MVVFTRADSEQTSLLARARSSFRLARKKINQKETTNEQKLTFPFFSLCKFNKPGMSLELPSSDGDAAKHEWMTPIDLVLSQELRLVHLKAGFELDGS